MTGLYMTSVIDTPSPNNIYTVDHGRLVAFPLEIAEGQSVEINCVHVATGIQDFSLRVWVSRADDIGGQSVGKTLPTRYWHPNRVPTERVVCYDAALPTPEVASIPLEPGSYLVNVLNLVNSRNGFAFVLTDLV